MGFIPNMHISLYSVTLFYANKVNTKEFKKKTYYESLQSFTLSNCIVVDKLTLQIKGNDFNWVLLSKVTEILNSL